MLVPGFRCIFRLAFILCAARAFSQTSPVYLNTAADRLLLGNATWEVAFSNSHGGILAITDKQAGATLTAPFSGCLWQVIYDLPTNTPFGVSGCAFNPAGKNSFAYQWSPVANTLTFTYAADPSTGLNVKATVTAVVTSENSLDLELSVTNLRADPSNRIVFPADIVFSSAAVTGAYLPFRLPGVRLNNSWFAQHVNLATVYPGKYATADWADFDVAGGNIALYSVSHPSAIVPVSISLLDGGAANPGDFTFYHFFFTNVTQGASWSSPPVRIRVGQTAKDAALAFRHESGLDGYPNIADKLGPRFDALSRSPKVLADFDIPSQAFNISQNAVATLAVPALLHPEGFQVNGFNENLPDILPPDPMYGTTADFAAWVAAAQVHGLFVMPYHDFSWWRPNSPTVIQLPAPLTITDVASLDINGQPHTETFDTFTGFVTSAFSPFLQQRLAAGMAQFANDIPVDFMFWDQTGSRDFFFDYNANAASSLGFYDGWIGLWNQYAPQGLFTEDGWDRLAQSGIGFMGSPLLLATSFDISQYPFGIGSDGNVRLGPGNWEPWPVATYMYHDKVLFYQHDLEGFATSQSDEAVTWDLLFGLSMDYRWLITGFPKPTADRIDLAHQLQRAFGPLYSGRTLDAYDSIDMLVRQSRWGNLTIIANWASTPYTTPDSYTILPGGYLARTDDGTLMAGAFTAQFNGAALNDGEHHILLQQSDSSITVRQPVGSDTPLTITLPPSWNGAQVLALDAAGNTIATVGSTANAGAVTFQYAGTSNGVTVDHYAVAPMN